MATWEIRQFNQEPLSVEVDDNRNLYVEYEQHRTQRSFFNKKPKLWAITEDCALHPDSVIGVVYLEPEPDPEPRPKRPKHKVIKGFFTER